MPAADALQRKVDESIAALEESAMLLEKREDDDAATLRKILGDNQALQLALRQVADQTAGNQQASANAHEAALLREKNRRLEEELGLLRLRVHGATTLTPHGATTQTPLAGSPPPKAGAAAKAAATGATTSDDARSQMSDEVRSLRADDDAKSTRSMRSSFSEASEFSISDAAAAAAGSPEVCGVGMRLTNVAPHRVCSPFSLLVVWCRIAIPRAPCLFSRSVSVMQSLIVGIYWANATVVLRIKINRG